ncbi:hypothetical protein TRICHSKD4_2428 [Roseibium sp. TrichSKD4]|uniref:hypothetical protein n=1 Tax=Roseibium sp. TrichSKD4 TaxID=744980 RepID=UPI0001E56B95|nr:hypothetical protein [Roseibium sp. TrichSKD4]EFO32626.1 hypothetical protein TRICHSKD4_2428 [Roseibium sp. TrichSKD4]
MSQPDEWGMALEGPATARQVAERLNQTFDALLTWNSGAVRPPYMKEGGVWPDTSIAGKVTYKFAGADQSGAGDIPFGVLDKGRGQFIPNLSHVGPQEQIASAATMDIGAKSAYRLVVTGNEGIQSLGGKQNVRKQLRFEGELTLTHDDAVLALPGEKDLTVKAGDVLEFSSDDAGKFRCDVSPAAGADGGSTSSSGVPVGFIAPDPSGTGFGPGWLKLGNGATFDVTIYKKLALKYPDGVLPDPDDRVLRGAGPLAGAAGTVLEDAFQDHPHEDAYASNVSDGTARTSVRTFGSGRTVAETGESQELPQGNAAEGNETHPLTGPASAVPGVRTASETRVKSLTVDWYIKAADTVNDPEVIQALAHVASLNAVVSQTGELERVAKNRVVNRFNTRAQYTAPVYTAVDGVEIAIFQTTIDNIKSGNAVRIDLGVFFESENNLVFWLRRGDVDLDRGGSAGGAQPGTRGIFAPIYDNHNGGTPNFKSLSLTDENPPAGSSTYKLMAQSSSAVSKSFRINEPTDGAVGENRERGVSWMELQELQA